MKLKYFVLTVLCCLGNCKPKNNVENAESKVKLVNAIELNGTDRAADDAVKDIVELTSPGFNNGTNCTGTFITPYVMVTAAHCIVFPSEGDPEETDTIDNGAVGVIFSRTDEAVIDSVKAFLNPAAFETRNQRSRTEYQMTDDFAIAVFAEDMGKRMGIKQYRKIAITPPSVGESVLLVGYGFDRSPDESSTADKRWGDNTISSVGILIKLSGASYNNIDNMGDSPIGTNVTAFSGDSGSSLLRGSMAMEKSGHKGEIIGIASGALPGYSYYLNITSSKAKKIFKEAMDYCVGKPCALNFVK